jgi:hypothetical protein
MLPSIPTALPDEGRIEATDSGVNFASESIRMVRSKSERLRNWSILFSNNRASSLVSLFKVEILSDIVESELQAEHSGVTDYASKNLCFLAEARSRSSFDQLSAFDYNSMVSLSRCIIHGKTREWVNAKGIRSCLTSGNQGPYDLRVLPESRWRMDSSHGTA